jgi:hypothetical protein
MLTEPSCLTFPSFTIHILAFWPHLSLDRHTQHLRPADKHRQNVITWPDRPQFSVRSPVRAASATNPFQLDTRAGKPGFSLMSRTKIRHLRSTRNHAVRRRARNIHLSYQTLSWNQTPTHTVFGRCGSNWAPCGPCDQLIERYYQCGHRQYS